MDIKFDFDDILLRPAVISDIESRSEINIFDEFGKLPLFTAPMDTVISLENQCYFEKNNINTIIPRTEDRTVINEWYSVSLTEFDDIYLKNTETKRMKVLIDVANGHMQKVLDYTKLSKEKYGDKLTLMVGNVANPLTYGILSDAGADYIRVGIGAGNACLTSKNTAVGYPMASLISECCEISYTLNKPAKIVADGGIKEYADIIKALNLGADYVMLGSMFNKALESCADTFFANKKYDSWTEPGEQVDQYSEQTKLLFKGGSKFYKKFRGMSTKEVQKKLGNTILKTSEGVVRINPVEYTLEGWVENFSHYLSSAMSYTDCRTLNEFIGNGNHIRITQNAYNRFNK